MYKQFNSAMTQSLFFLNLDRFPFKLSYQVSDEMQLGATAKHLVHYAHGFLQRVVEQRRHTLAGSDGLPPVQEHIVESMTFHLEEGFLVL